MKKLLFILFLLPLSLFAQEDKAALERDARKLVREGNELFNQLKFADAEVAYKKALEKDPSYEIANYNLGNAFSLQNRSKEAVTQFELVAKTTKDKFTRAEAMHNIGNSHYQGKEYQKAVDSYKHSLRANPKDDETRYNLALAQKMLKDQQENQDKNKDKNDDKKDKDQENKDDKNKEKDEDKKEGDDKKDDEKKDGEDEKDKDNPEKDKEDKKQDQKPQPGKLSPQQMKQLLEAMNNEEKKTQEKMNAKRKEERKSNKKKIGRFVKMKRAC